MNVLDLFSGIGGFSLGLERAGMRTVAFCEIDPFCRRVLAKHWPDVPVYDDVRTLTAARVGSCGQFIDVICGGFPCQDISFAGKGAGIGGERSGLWSEYARIIGEVRPKYVIVENVAALLGRGLERVLGDLAALGFDAEWHCIPASAVGAPHRRDRVWIVAHSDANGNGTLKQTYKAIRQFERRGEDVSDTDFNRLETSANDGILRLETDNSRNSRYLCPSSLSRDEWWLIEPDVGRVANGVPARVDRLRSLGNAVIPQIPEIIGRAIIECSRS